MNEVEVFPFQGNFTESKSDNSGPYKWSFKVCMSCWVNTVNVGVIHEIFKAGGSLIIHLHATHVGLRVFICTFSGQCMYTC